MDLNEELIFIPADEDTIEGVGEAAGDMGEDWDLIFLKTGIVTKDTKADVERVMNLIKSVTD